MKNYRKNPIDVCSVQSVMHGQANHAARHLVCPWKILRSRAREPPISAEGADKRIEIPPSQNTVLFHLEIQFIPRHPVFFRIHENGEIGIVVADIGHIVKEGDARDTTQCFPIPDSNLMPCFDGRIHLLEIQ